MNRPIVIFAFLITLLSLSQSGALATNSVYYSVSPFGTGDIKTGSPTITISSGVATLSVAQTGNIGMGVCIDFAGGTEVWISQVNSPTSFNVVTATGATPTDVTIPQTVNSIHHEYASLFDFEAGFTDANHIANTSLVSADVVAYACCYYDHDDYTADQTAVTINFGSTDSTHYLEIFTPTGGTQSINNQRHHGIFGETGSVYRLVTTGSSNSITNYENYLIIDGLLIDSQYMAFYNRVCGGWIYLRNCIMNGVPPSWTGVVHLFENYGYTFTVYFYNNIIKTTKSNAYSLMGYATNLTAYLYNNTFIANYLCIHSLFGSLVAKNNLLQTYSPYSYVYPCAGTFAAGTDYNATNKSSLGYTVSGGGNIHDRVSQTFSFADEDNDDFHLTSGDDGAKDHGVSLNPDPDGYLSFSDDIDGDTRPGVVSTDNWDIGADEFYYSSVNLEGVVLEGVNVGGQ